MSTSTASAGLVDSERSSARTVTYSSGLKATTYQPRQGFSLAAASDTDLVRIGLPVRPDDPELRARYDRVLHSLAGKFNYIPATLRHNAHVVHGPRRSSPDAGTETSTNWSGAVVFAEAGQAFRWVQGDWVIPDVDAPTENQWYYCASWIGIDGDGSGDVCQAGVECEAYRSGTSVTRNIYPWWEWYPEAEIAITNLPVNPGDLLTALICTAGAGATQATLVLSNRTTGASTTVTFTAPAGTSLVGNCAEWIVEAPTVDGGQSRLADYGQVFFSNADAFDGKATLGGGTGDNINMNDGGGNEVSAGTLVTSTIVECEYVGPLP